MRPMRPLDILLAQWKTRGGPLAATTAGKCKHPGCTYLGWYNVPGCKGRRFCGDHRVPVMVCITCAELLLLYEAAVLSEPEDADP